MAYMRRANKYERLAIAGEFDKLLEHAESGRATAQLALAQSIENELFEPEDGTKKASYWINLAANEGLPEAMLRLAYSLEGAERIHWLEKASELEQPYAMLALSTHYHFGDGVTEDKAEHFQLTLEASRFDIPVALQGVGDSYMTGIVVEKDLHKACEFYKRAREHFINPSYWYSVSEFDKYCATDADLGTDEAWLDERQLRDIQDRLVAVTLLISLQAGEKNEKYVFEVINSLGENTRRLHNGA